MATNTSLYKYSIELYAIIDNIKIDINPSYIISVTTDYNYDINNMPAIYITTNIPVAIYDKLLANISNGDMILTIYKYDTKSTFGLKTEYIRERFAYLIPSDPTYTKSNITSYTNEQEAYSKVVIALVKRDSFTNNKQVINTIFKNTNKSSIIHKYTNGMNMIIEQFDHNSTFNYLVIPPIETVTGLITYLNNIEVFYDSGYRYFRDFKKTYLLSNRGQIINDSTDTSMNSIIINIISEDNEESISNLSNINSNANAYVLTIPSNKCSIDINSTLEKSYNTILGITTSGNTVKRELDIPKDEDDNSEKIKLYRLYNENINYIDNLYNNISSSSVILHISKTELDSSFITPNKEYLVNNRDYYKEYNGRYILSYKKEVFIKEDDSYISATMFGIRRVASL